MGIDARTPVPTTKGWLPAGQIVVGDEIFGFDGMPVKVTTIQKYTPTHCYKVWLQGGITLVVDNKTGIPSFDQRTYTQYRRWTRTRSSIAGTTLRPQSPQTMIEHPYGRPRVPVCRPIQPKERSLPVSPFEMGRWIFERSLRRKESRSDITRELIERYPVIPTHIPEEYLFASFRQRLELLRGIVSTRTRCYKKKTKGFEIFVLDLRLARQVQQLVESLGAQTSLTRRTKNGQYLVRFRTILRLVEEQEAPSGLHELECRIVEEIQKIDARECIYIKTEDPNNTFLVSEGYLGVSL